MRDDYEDEPKGYDPPEGAVYMGLDDTGLPYWYEENVGFVGEGWR